jgi:hypothetical protein
MTDDTPPRPRRPQARRADTSTADDRLLSADRRAVSNLVGFLLIFAIIITSVGAISTFGYDALLDLRESEQLNNADRAFEILKANFDEVARGDAPRRTGQIDLNDGSLRVRNDTIIDVTVNGTGETESLAVRTLQYRVDETTIAYQSGLTARRQDGGTALRKEPEFACTETAAVVSVVELTDPGRQVTTGTVGVIGRLNRSTVLFPNNRTGSESNRDPHADNVTISVDSPYAGGWEQFFQDSDNDWSKNGTNTYECTGVDRVVVRLTVVDVSFQR